MHSFLLVFIDGIGLGPPGPSNPFATLSLRGFARLAAGQRWTAEAASVDEEALVFRSIDACLGVDGLPQSGTGQATLFTGVNCARLAGRHYGPFPHSSSIPVIKSESIFARLAALGLETAFINAYPDVFFTLARKRNRWPVTTRACLESKVALRTMSDLRSGRALAADITGEGLRDRFDADLSTITEAQAAERFLELAAGKAFTAFEYFLTDRAGHRKDAQDAFTRLNSLDAFLGTLSAQVRDAGVTLIVTSDHGNLENLSVRTHTRNPVPLAALGSASSYFVGVAALTDIVPSILDALSA